MMTAPWPARTREGGDSQACVGRWCWGEQGHGAGGQHAGGVGSMLGGGAEPGDSMMGGAWLGLQSLVVCRPASNRCQCMQHDCPASGLLASINCHQCMQHDYHSSPPLRPRRVSPPAGCSVSPPAGCSVCPPAGCSVCHTGLPLGPWSACGIPACQPTIPACLPAYDIRYTCQPACHSRCPQQRQEELRPLSAPPPCMAQTVPPGARMATGYSDKVTVDEGLQHQLHGD